MPELPSISTTAQEWIRKRADVVRTKYTAYQCLHEHGHGEHLVDEDTPISIFCPFHGNVNTMAARYYPAGGRRSDYVRCFRCHENWDCLNLYMRFKGCAFMDALKELERRFSIKVSARPEDAAPEEPIVDKSSSNYMSGAWSDVPRVLDLLEEKLERLRDKAPMHEFVRFCRVLDSVGYDLDLAKGAQTHEMVEVLAKLRERMDACAQLSSSVDLQLSTGEDISVAELDPESVPCLRDDAVLLAAAQFLSLCTRAPRQAVEDAKSGLPESLEAFLRAPPVGCLVKVEQHACAELRHCAISDGTKCSTRYLVRKRPAFPMCWTAKVLQHGSQAVVSQATDLADSIVSAWRDGHHVVPTQSSPP